MCPSKVMFHHKQYVAVPIICFIDSSDPTFFWYSSRASSSVLSVSLLGFVKLPIQTQHHSWVLYCSFQINNKTAVVISLHCMYFSNKNVTHHLSFSSLITQHLKPLEEKTLACSREKTWFSLWRVINMKNNNSIMMRPSKMVIMSLSYSTHGKIQDYMFIVEM